MLSPRHRRSLAENDSLLVGFPNSPNSVIPSGQPYHLGMNYVDIESIASGNDLFCTNPMDLIDPYVMITPPTSTISEGTGNSEFIVNNDWVSSMDLTDLVDLPEFNTPSTVATYVQERNCDSPAISHSAKSCETDSQSSTTDSNHSLQALGKCRPSIQAISANYIREDFLELLEINLPYWKENGLWGQQRLLNPCEGSGHENLKNVYSCICELDRYIQTDPIRERVAMVLLYLQFQAAVNDWDVHDSQEERTGQEERGIGQGKLTRMIDSILQNSHSEWGQYNATRRTQLRARFHNRKRYGKRWSIFIEELGPAIIFLCSSVLANILYVSAPC